MIILRGIWLIVVLVFCFQDSSGQSLQKASLLLMQEDYRGAISQLDYIIKADSSNSQALYKLGLSYQGLNNYVLAGHILKFASKKDSQNIPVLLSLAKSYKNSGNYSGAAGIYHRVLKIDSLNQSAAINLSALYLDQQEYNRAKDLYFFLSGRDTANNYYLKQLGLCFFKLEDLKTASQYYEKALKIYSSDINASLDLSLIYFKMEKLDSAFMTLHKVYGLYGEDPRLDKMLGEIHMKRKDYVYAEKYFKRAIENGDSSAAVLQKTGIAVYLAGMFNSPPDSAVLANTFSEARDLLEKSYKKYNKDALTALYLGLSYKELHNYPAAIKLIEESLNLAVPPYMGDVYNYLASAYDYNGEYQKALNTYNDALEHNPANKIIYYYMAYIYDKRLFQREAALKYYQKFISWSDADKLLKAFAETRVDKLKEEQFFRSGSSQK